MATFLDLLEEFDFFDAAFEKFEMASKIMPITRDVRYLVLFMSDLFNNEM